MSAEIREVFEQERRSFLLAQKLQNRYEKLHRFNDAEMADISNNSRYHLDEIAKYTLIALREKDKTRRTEYNHILIGAFADAGDPLCIRLKNYIIDALAERVGHEGVEVMFNNSEVAEKLLLRRMKQEEYFGILNGEIPFGQDGEKKYYLPKPQKRFWMNEYHQLIQ
jgi:hypothetical protein